MLFRALEQETKESNVHGTKFICI